MIFNVGIMDSLGNSFNPNKRLKEEFVSNLTGSSMFEVFIQMTLVSVVILLRHWVSSCIFTNPDSSVASWKKNDIVIVRFSNLTAYIARFLVDYIFTVIPFLLLLTVLSEWIYTLAILLTLLLFVIAIRSNGSSIYGGSMSPRTHMSSYRVTMMILTCLCILAVDFKIFPRRYAKTETYGTSVMDLGVGSFVLAKAMVSRQARNVKLRSWTSALNSSSPLLLLGIGRLVFTRGVNYQVHVGEYGVHWNFFFTLAVVSILSALINVPPQYCGLLGSLILLGYQYCLVHGLNIYLLSSEREMDIISENKEGIFSIFGYWGLYLVGVQLGNYIFFENISTDMLKSKNWAWIRVLIFAFIFWSLTFVLERHVERASRRMCNLAYVTTVLAVNLQVLAGIILAGHIFRSKLSVLEAAFNQNLLPLFLLANVLTGLVNLSVDTMDVSSSHALVILFIYTFMFSVVVGVADFYSIKLKFW